MESLGTLPALQMRCLEKTGVLSVSRETSAQVSVGSMRSRREVTAAVHAGSFNEPLYMHML